MPHPVPFNAYNILWLWHTTWTHFLWSKVQVCLVDSLFEARPDDWSPRQLIYHMLLARRLELPTPIQP